MRLNQIMQQPKVKIVLSNKLPAQLRAPLNQQPKKKLEVEKSKSKNPFKSYRKYLIQAELCTQEISKIPDLSLQMVSQLMLNRAHLSSLPKRQQSITVGIIKRQARSGTVKKMFNFPTFSILAAKQQPFKSKVMIDILKDWISSCWKKLDYQQHFLKILVPFWGQPQCTATFYTEYAQGGSLDQLLRSVCSLPQKAIRQMIAQILQAYQISIQQKIVYDALSPSQILFTLEGRVKLSLGLSKKLKNHLDGTPSDVRWGNLWNQDYAQGDYLKSQIFKLGLISLLSGLGSYEICQQFQKLISNATTLIRTKKKSLCCLVHSQAIIRGSNVKRASLSLIQLMSQYSLQFQNFLCGCLKINSSQRLNIVQLLNHPFLIKNSDLKKIGLKEMIKLKEDPIKIQLKKVGEKRLQAICQNISVVAGQLRKQQLRQAKNLIKIESSTIRILSKQLGVQRGKIVLGIKGVIP